VELRDAAGVVASPLSLKLATATTPEGARYDAVEEAVALTNAIGAAMAAQKPAEPDAEGNPAPEAKPIDTIAQAATAAIPHIAGQPFAKELVATAVSAVGTHLQNGGEIAGLSSHSGDVMMDVMVDAMSEVFVNTTTENLSETTNTLFGIDLNAIEEEKKTEKEREKEAKKAEKEAAKESKKAEKEAAKESKKAEKTSAPETTQAPETSKKPETTKVPADTNGPAEPDETETVVTPESTVDPETSKTPETTKEPEAPKEPEVPTTQGALAILSNVDFNNATAIFNDEAQCASLAAAVYVLDANPSFAPVVSAFGTLGGQLMQENSAAILPNMTEEDLHRFHERLMESVGAEGKYHPTRAMADKMVSVKADILEIATSYNYPVTDKQAELGAICLIARFCTAENMANPSLITFEDFTAYLGVK